MDAQTLVDCELIDAFLDEPGADRNRLPEAVAQHLAGCEACRTVFDALWGVHAQLLSAASPEPPAHFASRTMARLELWERGRPAWQPAVYQLGAIVSGLAFAGAALGLLRLDQAPLPYAFWVATATAWLRYIVGLGASLAERPWMAVSYPIIAVMLAAMWFLALAGPRLLFGRGSRRAL